MIQNYIDAFNIPLASPRMKLLLEYYDISQEYERNFEYLHEAYRNGNTEAHKHHLEIESQLYKKCRKLRDELRPGIDNDIEDTAKPNAICNQCNQKYHKDNSRQSKDQQRSNGICRACVSANAREKRLQSKINRQKIDIMTDYAIKDT